jgi:hypothetical protein
MLFDVRNNLNSYNFIIYHFFKIIVNLHPMPLLWLFYYKRGHVGMKEFGMLCLCSTCRPVFKGVSWARTMDFRYSADAGDPFDKYSIFWIRIIYNYLSEFDRIRVGDCRRPLMWLTWPNKWLNNPIFIWSGRSYI